MNFEERCSDCDALSIDEDGIWICGIADAPAGDVAGCWHTGRMGKKDNDEGKST